MIDMTWGGWGRFTILLALTATACGTGGATSPTSSIPTTKFTGVRFAEAVAFSPDGHYVAAAGGSEALRWEVAQPSATRVPLDDCHGAKDMRFSPDGTKLACSPGVVKMLDAKTGKTIEGPASGMLTGIATTVSFSPDGSMFVERSVQTAGNGITVLKTADWLPLTYLGKNEANTLARFSPDGGQILVAGARDCRTRAWSIKEEKELWATGTCSGASTDNAIAWGDDLILVAGERLSMLSKTGGYIGSKDVLAKEAPFSDVAITPDAAYFAVSNLFEAFLFKRGSVEPVWRSGQRGTKRGLAFSSDGKYFAFTTRDGVELLPTASLPSP